MDEIYWADSPDDIQANDHVTWIDNQTSWANDRVSGANTSINQSIDATSRLFSFRIKPQYLANATVNGTANSSDWSNSSSDCEQCGFCHYDNHTVYVMGFLATHVIVFGIAANLLNARIFTHRFMRSSLLNWYYGALSISDLVLLSISFFRDCLPRLSDYGRTYGLYSAMSTLTPATQTIGCMAQTASVFLTVGMTAHRFVGVCFPFKAHRICTRNNTILCMLSVVGFAILFNLTRAFEVSTHVFECNGTEGIESDVVEPWPTAFRRSPYYQTYYYGWAYTIVMYVIPFTLLIILNIRVMLAIRRTSNLHRRMSIKEANVTKRTEISKEISTSVMLMGVVIVFLVCNTPAFMANMIEVLHLVSDDDIYTKVVDYNNLLVILNASINCFVYLSFSDKYRALLKHYLTFSCFHDSEPLIDMSTAAGTG